MAMSGGKDDGSPMGEMNSTPLIDVMLVLLIMFIITIPPVTHAVKIDLPIPNNEPSNEPIVDPVINKILILPTNELLWNGTPISLDQMTQYLEQTKAMSPEPELQFQPAPTTGYEIVDFALARIKKAEVEKFGFVGNEQYYNFDKADNEP